MTFPSKEPPDTSRVYTEVQPTARLNRVKPREVECIYCKYTTETDLVEPKCKTCHHSMITVVNGKLANGNR